jgi:hypothetical protein
MTVSQVLQELPSEKQLSQLLIANNYFVVRQTPVNAKNIQRKAQLKELKTQFIKCAVTYMSMKISVSREPASSEKQLKLFK